MFESAHYVPKPLPRLTPQSASKWYAYRQACKASLSLLSHNEIGMHRYGIDATTAEITANAGLPEEHPEKWVAIPTLLVPATGSSAV